MTNIICIYSFKESSWVSCKKIVFNLLSSYQGVNDLEITPFNYDQDTSVDDIIVLLKMVQDIKPQKIVFLDHKPHPMKILQVLSKNLEKLPEIIFHLFGDFTIYYREWEFAEQYLKGQKLTFVVPSERQKNLIEKFLQNVTCHVCPFPVDPKEFSFDKKLRETQRREWKVEEDSKVFVYTGRLSRQKRIHTLLKAFALVAEKHPKAHLFLYGQTDHIGDQFLNIWESEGEYLIRILRIYESLSEDVRKRIHVMGNVDWKKLRSVYSGSDYFVSLSVHNDEDYGMSVAEAQANGLPCLITNWGGFASFALEEYPEAVRFISVKFGTYQKLVSKNETMELLDDVLTKNLEMDREKIVTISMEKRSIKRGTEIVQKILRSPPVTFDGFTPFFKHIISRLEFSKGVYVTKKQQISNLYKKIYESYLR